MLRDKNACQEQVELFETLYPDGVQVTEAACVAVADKFAWDWAAGNFLSDAAYAEYQRVMAAAFGRCAEAMGGRA